MYIYKLYGYFIYVTNISYIQRMYVCMYVCDNNIYCLLGNVHGNITLNTGAHVYVTYYISIWGENRRVKWHKVHC